MSAVAKSVYRLRRQAVEWWGLLVSAGFAVLIGTGFVSGEKLVRGDLLVLSALGVFAVTLGRCVLREVSPGPAARGAAAAARELELGLLLITGCYLLLATTGGTHSFLYPLVYALVSFLLIVNERRWVAVVWLSFLVGLELLLARASAPGRMPLAYSHLTFVGFFAAGNLLVLSGLAKRLRGEHGRKVSAELDRMRQEAKDFRLLASQLPLDSRAERSREDEELRMAQGAVHAIHEQLFFTIDLLCSSLHLHTCALLWLPGGGAAARRGDAVKLTIKELATSSGLVKDSPVIDTPGILTTVLRNPKPLRLKSLGGKRVPPYYEGPEAVTDLCAVPLKDGQALRGMLVADRVTDRPFTDAEEEALAKAAEYVLRIIQQERAFAAVERSKYEQEQFYRASELLNEALTYGDVYDKTFEAVQAIVPSNLFALTLWDEGARQHRVLAARTDEAGAEDAAWRDVVECLQELTFSHGGGLVSCAVKNRHHMPASGDISDSDVVVFDDKLRLRKARSLLVLPLMRGDHVLGTMVLASSRAGQYPPATREMIRVISHQVSVSLQNARMYQQMEEKATTDGLTGLLNHRAFQDRYEQLHALCERTGQRFSVILTDIDHFKSVNDTYGHPVGDAVLKRVAALFASRARKVDIVARYGGEEFVLVLPDTDATGAAKFANRVREELEAQTMTSDNGSFKVTISMGVAEFPVDSRDRKDLVEKSDQALYYCKEHGRNCVTRWRDC